MGTQRAAMADGQTPQRSSQRGQYGTPKKVGSSAKITQLAHDDVTHSQSTIALRRKRGNRLAARTIAVCNTRRALMRCEICKREDPSKLSVANRGRLTRQLVRSSFTVAKWGNAICRRLASILIDGRIPTVQMYLCGTAASFLHVVRM